MNSMDQRPCLGLKRNRIPASILYVRLLKNLDSFKAGITVSGIVGKDSYKIQKVEVVQNQRQWSVKVLEELLGVFRGLLPGANDSHFGVRFGVKIKQQEIAEDGSWARILLEYAFETHGALGSADGSAFQYVTIRVNDQGNLEWAFGQISFP